MEAGDTIVGRYRLESVLGRGTFGEVWRATQLDTNRTVALKLLKNLDDIALTRLDREVAALRRVSHRNCVGVLDTGVTPAGTSFLVMELVEGQPLANRRETAVPVEQVRWILSEIAAGLAAAHTAGVAHRDLKPENVIIGDDTNQPALKVVDFGLAKVYETDQVDVTATGEIFGTPQYMSPEQFRGSRDAGPPSDVYALGVLAFELLEGRLPFQQRVVLDLAMAHVTEPPPPIRREGAEDLSWLVAAMLSKEPRDRPTANEVHRALSQAEPQPAPNGTRLAVGATLAVVLLIIAVAVLQNGADSPPPQKPIATEPANDRENAFGERELEPEAVPIVEDARRELVTTPGMHELRISEGLSIRRVAVYLPKREPPFSTVLVFHRRQLNPPGHQGAQLLDQTELRALADKHGFLLVAGESDDAWEALDHEVDFVDKVVEEVNSRFAVDPSRLFALGYATGGDFAHYLACQRALSAVATISAAEFEESCVGDAVPFLRIYGRDDANSPFDGGRGCGLFGNTRERLSVGAINERWRMRNETQKVGRSWGPRDGGQCEIWRGRAPFASCAMNGGRYIELDRPEIEEPGCEASLKPNSFPATRVVVTFFAEEGGRLE